jgi:hypothetical protein
MPSPTCTTRYTCDAPSCEETAVVRYPRRDVFEDSDLCAHHECEYAAAGRISEDERIPLPC